MRLSFPWLAKLNALSAYIQRAARRTHDRLRSLWARVEYRLQTRLWPVSREWLLSNRYELLAAAALWSLWFFAPQSPNFLGLSNQTAVLLCQTLAGILAGLLALSVAVAVLAAQWIRGTFRLAAASEFGSGPLALLFRTYGTGITVSLLTLAVAYVKNGNSYFRFRGLFFTTPKRQLMLAPHRTLGNSVFTARVW